MTFNKKLWFVLKRIHKRDKFNALICLSILYIYIKAFCKLQVAKAGLGPGVAKFLPLLLYIKIDSL